MEIVAGRVSIRLEPALIERGLNACAMIRDCGTGELFPLATGVKPVAYELPLAAGWEPTNQWSACHYWKTQDGAVAVNLTLLSTVPVTNGMVIATSPAGFLPEKTLHIPVSARLSDGRMAPGHIDINAVNGRWDLWDIDGAGVHTVKVLYCPTIHYLAAN